MDLSDVQFDLQALRKLYCLLQNSGDSLPKSRNEILDERAKLLLKNLLDGATDKALERNSKIIASAKSNVSGAEKFSMGFPIQSAETDSNCLIFNATKDELSLNKPTPEKVVSNLSYKPCNRKKGCPFCEESSAKKPGKVAKQRGKRNDQLGPLKAKEDTEWVKNNQRSKRINKIQRNPSVACSPSSPATGNGILFDQFEKKSEDLSMEVANAIRRIESAILELQSTRDGLRKKVNLVKKTRHVNASQQRNLNDVKSSRRPNHQLASQNKYASNDDKADNALKIRKQKEAKRNVVKSVPFIMRPTLLDAYGQKNGTQKRTHMDMNLESSETASSSSWTTHGTSSTDSLSSKTLVHHRFGNKRNSDSEEESSSITSWADSTRTYGSDHHAGRMRRFRNKIGLIFHHHHHHHHYHENYKHKDPDIDDKIRYTKPMRKHSPNIFHQKQGFEKLRKSRDIIKPSQHQANYFHTIVEGLRRHVWVLKKSKLGRGRSPLRHLHWWQMFKRKGGLKLGKKGRLRLGLKTKTRVLQNRR